MASFTDVEDALDTIQTSLNALRATANENNTNGHFNDDRDDVVKMQVVVDNLNALNAAVRAATAAVSEYRV